jgi:hypothetical protein
MNTIYDFPLRIEKVELYSKISVEWSVDNIVQCEISSNSAILIFLYINKEKR